MGEKLREEQSLENVLREQQKSYRWLIVLHASLIYQQQRVIVVCSPLFENFKIFYENSIFILGWFIKNVNRFSTKNVMKNPDFSISKNGL